MTIWGSIVNNKTKAENDRYNKWEWYVLPEAFCFVLHGRVVVDVDRGELLEEVVVRGQVRTEVFVAFLKLQMS